MNVELRAVTKNQRNLESAVIMSSVIPSAKNSCSGSPDIFSNANTAIVEFTDHYGTPARAPYDSQLGKLLERVDKIAVDPKGFDIGTDWLTVIANLTERAQALGKVVAVTALTKLSGETADATGQKDRLVLVDRVDDVWRLP